LPSPDKIVNHLVGKAMHDFCMLRHLDRVMIAVSGGVDSLVLACLLKEWLHKAPIHYELLAVHLDLGFEQGTAGHIKDELARLGLPCHIEQTNYGPEAIRAGKGKNVCFHCSRRRRNRLFALARERGYNRLAFGHHQEDIIETFFLNLFFGGNLSTMVPCQDLFEGRLTLIRPLALTDKEAIKAFASRRGIRPLKNPCPLADRSRRSEVRIMLDSLYAKDKRIKANIFAALANVKEEYLLRPKQS